MVINSLASVPKIPVSMEGAEKTHKQVPLSKNDGAPLFSFRVFTLEPGGNTPYHDHPFEHLNYIIRGEGVAVDREGNKHPVKEGDFIMVLPGEIHQYRNEALKGDFIFICAVPKEYE